MSDVRVLGPTGRFTVRQQLSLGWAFVDRQKNLWKRHWAWEVVWLVYGVVNTLAITFIAKQLTAEGIVKGQQANNLLLFLLIGTLVSGVYYSVETLPVGLRVLSYLSPATYLLRGVRAAIINGATIGDEGWTLAILALFAIVLIPLSIAVFSAAERWAKRTGRLKRQ